MVADKNVRMSGKSHRLFSKLSAGIDVHIKDLLDIAATPPILDLIKDEAVNRRRNGLI